MTSTLDQRINALRPGQEIRISPGDTTIWVTAERSGDGKWVRFVRHTLNGYTVIRTARFWKKDEPNPWLRWGAARS